MLRRPSGWLRGAFASWALAAAGAVAAWAAPPVSSGWTADPDDQFMLDVNIRQLRLGDGVRAYQTPEGTCIVFGDFLATLDVPMKIDLATKRASGWAFREAHRIDIDHAAGTVHYGQQQERLSPGTVRETPEGWCVDSVALGRWFKLGVRPVTAGSILLLESEAKLPVELARERELRAAHMRPAAMPMENLPRVRLPYRLWRAPALDFIVSAGVTYTPLTVLGSIAALRLLLRASSPSYPTTRLSRPTTRADRGRCGCAPIARIPTVSCSARSARPISRSAMCKACRAA